MFTVTKERGVSIFPVEEGPHVPTLYLSHSKDRKTYSVWGYVAERKVETRDGYSVRLEAFSLFGAPQFRLTLEAGVPRFSAKRLAEHVARLVAAYERLAGKRNLFPNDEYMAERDLYLLRNEVRSEYGISNG